MKDSQLLIVVALAGVGLYLFAQSRQTGPTQSLTGQALTASQSKWYSVIGALPAANIEQQQKTLRQLQGDVSAAQGTISGASAGAVAGPYGAAIGAGAGFVYSLFK